MKQKLNAKDFILIGVLTALMWIICMIISTIMSVAGPVTNVFYPALVAIPNGIVMMLLLAKVPKKGVFTICSAIQAILFLLVGAFWFIPIGLVIGGYGSKRDHNEIHDGGLCVVQCDFCFQRHLPYQIPSECFRRRHGEKQHCPRIHRRNAKYHFRSHAVGHCCGWSGRRSDWWSDWTESVKETLY